MKKSISKAMLLLVAVVMMFSSFGVTTAVAADSPVIYLDSGAITISAGGSGINIVQGQTTKTIPITDTVVISSRVASTANTITVANNFTANIRFQGAVNIAAPAAKSAFTIESGSVVNLTGTANSSLTGGAPIALPIAQSAGFAFNNGGTLNVTGGSLSLGGGVSGSLTVNGGSVTLQSGTVSGTATLNGGTFAVGPNATIPASLAGTGGITVNGQPASYKTVITGLPTGMAANLNGVTYSTNNAGELTAYLPPKAPMEYSIVVGSETYVSTFAVAANHNNKFSASKKDAKATITLTAPNPMPNYGRDIVIGHNGGAGFNAEAIDKITRDNVFVSSTLWSVSDKAITIKGVQNESLSAQTFRITLKSGANFIFAGSTPTETSVSITVLPNVAVVQTPSPNLGYYTGTSVTTVKKDLPQTVTVKLDGVTDVVWPIIWNTNDYRSTTTAKQTIVGTITVPATATLASNTINAYVTLERRSSGGGGSTNEPDPEYEYWRKILDEVKTAESGDTIHAYSKEYDNFPTSILDSLKGKKVTLIIQRSKGDDITIYGKNIKSVESGRITYKLTDLAKLYKNSGSSGSGSSSTSRPAPSTAPSTNYYYPPVVSSSASSSVSTSSSESSEESSSEEEEISSEEESSEEEEMLPTEPTDVKPTKKKMSPLTVAIIITVAAAALSGVVACIILQQRRKKDQF